MTNKDNKISTNQIIQGCKEGVPHCQKELYEMTVRRLYNVVNRMVLNHHEVQDILQETYIKVFQNIDQFDENRGTVFSWMSKISINICINHLKKKRIFFEDQEQLFLVPDLQNSALENLEAEYIFELILTLSEAQRIVFNLHEIEGFKHEEIAECLGLSIGACRAYLSRAKKKLQMMILKSETKVKYKTS